VNRSKADYRNTVSYLYGLEYRGIKYGLKNIRALLAACGHPERAFASFHIAGTNGKGSTSSFLASILQESGYRTALYTSPHLIRFPERIRINGVEITEERLVEYVHLLRKEIERTRATFFEATTAVALKYFADEKVDIAVIETGLGGRLDATNVLHPLVSVITNVAMDHMEYLGRTISAIAREKAGIIKPGVPVVTASTSLDALRVLQDAARHRGSAFHHVWEVVQPEERGGRKGRAIVQFRGVTWRLRPVLLGHAGAHQVPNAALALAALSLVQKRSALDAVTARSVERGLRNVYRNTGLGGRLQVIECNGVRVTLDVAHNPDGMRALVDSLAAGGVVYPMTVFGIVNDKDAGAVLDELRRVTREVVAVRPATKRARSGREIARMATERGIMALDGGSVSQGLRLALDRLRTGYPRTQRRLLVVGSHYLVGEALSWIQKGS
jgi:dihydrofolate synthase/folylpolyglutamate synthase